MAAGLAAYTQFQPGDAEPAGWDRHPATHRYRLDGDPTCEYWKDEHLRLHAVGPAVEIVHNEPRRKERNAP